MLWLALHFPALSLEVFSRGGAASVPLAITEKHGSRTRVMACSDAAQALGVRPGMPSAAALALANDLVVRPRDPLAEQDALAGLAGWAGRFTPGVSLEPPAGLLLEIGTCLNLHGGLNPLLEQVCSGLESLAYSYTYACAPTASAAWLLACAGLPVVVRDPAQLEASLGPLPVSLLATSRAALEGLEMIGAHTLGDCLRLPRAGMARRFGQDLLDRLDRALGRLPEARAFFVAPDSFERRLELPAPVHEAEALLFAARRLLPELEGYLALRQAGVQEIELVCRHEGRPETRLKIGFVKPVRASARMLVLLRETLGQTRLTAPVHSIVLLARCILPLHQTNHELFQESQETGDANLLLERLRLRLGRDAVFGVAPAADHRPERAWKRCEAGEAAAGPDTRQRPLWLLPKPRPCRDGGLVLKAGPERIESGWWDGRNALRDYYVAQDSSGARLWVYCERESGEWFVHGLFA